MKILVVANQVPFMRGGADYHIEGLVKALGQYGHSVETWRFPFRFTPESDIDRLMNYCEGLECEQINGVTIDKVISLQFPAYGVKHENHSAWIMHQHRVAYELYDKNAASTDFRDRVRNFDNKVLGRMQKRYANSQRVANRLNEFNNLVAEPLYHPPYLAEHFFSEDDLGYVFFPSRLEKLKRQNLLIEALRFCKTAVKAVIAGDGPEKKAYQSLINQYGLQDKVRLVGRISEAEKLSYYARCLGVFFSPFDEDYGYITLEAMLSSKPVITCQDSGGPLEFVRDKENGFITNPDPVEIALVLDTLYSNRAAAREMGIAGRQYYDALNINWGHVVTTLMS